MAEQARGIDISSYQDPPYTKLPIDWGQVATAGLDFAFVKVSEGTGYRAEYKSQWDGAGSIGLLRSGYHYLHGEVGGAAANGTITSGKQRVGTSAPYSYVLVQDGHKTIELSATEVAAIWAANPTMPTRVVALRDLIGVKINKVGLIAADTEFEHMNTLFPTPDEGFVVTG